MWKTIDQRKKGEKGVTIQHIHLSVFSGKPGKSHNENGQRKHGCPVNWPTRRTMAAKQAYESVRTDQKLQKKHGGIFIYELNEQALKVTRKPEPHKDPCAAARPIETPWCLNQLWLICRYRTYHRLMFQIQGKKQRERTNDNAIPFYLWVEITRSGDQWSTAKRGNSHSLSSLILLELYTIAQTATSKPNKENILRFSQVCISSNSWSALNWGRLLSQQHRQMITSNPERLRPISSHQENNNSKPQNGTSNQLLQGLYMAQSRHCLNNFIFLILWEG